MTQLNTPNILTVMCAPALVCTAAGFVEAVNERAADWLGTTTTIAAGLSLHKLLNAPGELLSDFLQRSERNGHACCKGHLYAVSDRNRPAAMSCHAQRLQGLHPAGNLLLVFAIVDPDDQQTESVPGFSSLTDSVTHTSSHYGVADSQPKYAEMNDVNALSEVALGLVHEVNQPLTAIAAYAQSCRRWLRADLTDHSKLLPTVEKIIEQVHITGQMINSLKGLVRGQDDERCACDLNQLVRESLELLSLDPRIERCEVKSHLEASPCPVLVSSVQIKIVLLNLLRNALEASLAFDAGESRLCVSVKAEEENWVSATVLDSGAGITAEAGEQLFQPFVTSKSKGLGLGLVISRCLATAHAGRIDYQPCVPHGASFKLRLPMAPVN